MTTNILVLGAGELGTAILTALAKHSSANKNANISVLLRPSTKDSSPPSKTDLLKTLSSLQISVVEGDVLQQSITSLASIFKDYDIVISALGFVGGPGLQVKLARAALEAKVSKYFPWQFGVDYDVLERGSAQPLFDEQLDVRDLLRAQKDVKWVVVSTGIFMSFLFEEFWGVVLVDDDGEGRRGVVRALGGWENAVTVTTPDDIGRLTAEIVFAETGVVDEVVHVAGDTISYGRLADVVDDVLGVRVEREVWDVPYLKEELRKDPEDTLKRYRVVFAQGKGVAWNKEDTFNLKHGIEVTDVEAFLRAKYK